MDHTLRAERDRLRTELQAAREREAALTQRLVELQKANEAMYRADYDRSGGVGFDIRRPFGSLLRLRQPEPAPTPAPAEEATARCSICGERHEELP